MMFSEALKECIGDEFSNIFQVLDPRLTMKTIVTLNVLEQCGLLQKKEEDEISDEGYSEESPRHQEEVSNIKREIEKECLENLVEEIFCKQRFKQVAYMMSATSGLFEDGGS